MNILITGANGFIAKNLIIRLSEFSHYKISTITKKTSDHDINKALIEADIIFHLAGVNKENFLKYSYENNYVFTKRICSFLENNKKKTKIIYASSIQVKLNNSYGKSKLKSEKILLNYKKKTNSEVLIYRLPNVFGKWSKPFYNSAVSTFCHQVLHNKKVNIIGPNKKISLLYIDDLIYSFLENIKPKQKKYSFIKIKNIFSITVLNLINLVKNFNLKDKTFAVKNISDSLVKNLYSTYISFFSKKYFFYKLKEYSDKRGFFCEFLKDPDFGQISFFSILPNQIRGNHYHHTKAEKFILITGKARFNFVNIITKQRFSILTNENKKLVINTVPGWAHNIENVGNKTAKVLVWSNEVFNKNNPDTFFYKI